MVSKRKIKAWTAARYYRKRIRDASDDEPYVPPPDTWGMFSDEFSEEFDK